MKYSKRSLLATFFIVGLLLVVNNSAYYFYSKNSLTNSLIDRMKSTAEQIRISIEHSEEGSFYVEDLIGENLRSVALYAQSQLEPDIDKVTNEQLETISRQAGVDAISLLARVGDDIRILKSSEPRELGLSTKNFNYWFTAFSQLLDHTNVTIPEGQKLPHFWSGIYEVPSSDSSEVSKFGYYFDGTTNYIICPFVQAERIVKFKQITGADTIVSKSINANKDILEISGFNANTFGKEPIVYTSASGDPFISVYDRPILFGSYELMSELDVEHVTEVIQTASPTSFHTTINGKQVLKTFVPVFVTDRKINAQREIPFVIGIVSDYQNVVNTLNKQLLQLALLVLVFTIVSILIVIISFRLYSKNKEQAVQSTQELYIDNMDKMFATIRGQRHDFLNHVQTIYSLITHGKKDDQVRYIKELVEDIYEVNDIIRIGHPAIAALIQSKVAVALQKKIAFTHRFSGLEGLSLGVKSVDIVKIIGNLIDNAFDEVMKLPAEERIVEVNGWSEDNAWCISVANPTAEPISEEKKQRMFQIGYSTKSGHTHHGLGLSVVMERIEHYRGNIDVRTGHNEIRFQITIPMQ